MNVNKILNEFSFFHIAHSVLENDVVYSWSSKDEPSQKLDFVISIEIQQSNTCVAVCFHIVSALYTLINLKLQCSDSIVVIDGAE